jgi:hypothetical protein
MITSWLTTKAQTTIPQHVPAALRRKQDKPSRNCGSSAVRIVMEAK